MLSLLKAIADLLHVCVCYLIYSRQRSFPTLLSLSVSLCVTSPFCLPACVFFPSVFLPSILLLSHSVTVESDCCLCCFVNDTFINKHYSNAYHNGPHVKSFPTSLCLTLRFNEPVNSAFQEDATAQNNHRRTSGLCLDMIQGFSAAEAELIVSNLIYSCCITGLL